MSNQILYLFALILGVSFHFSFYKGNKHVQFSYNFSQKHLEFFAKKSNKAIVLYLGLMLLPSIEDIVFQELCSKRYALIPQKASNFKMVFALLIEV